MDLEQCDIQANNPGYGIPSVSSGYFPFSDFTTKTNIHPVQSSK
jgi:hypothetical protein